MGSPRGLGVWSAVFSVTALVAGGVTALLLVAGAVEARLQRASFDSLRHACRLAAGHLSDRAAAVVRDVARGATAGSAGEPWLVAALSVDQRGRPAPASWSAGDPPADATELMRVADGGATWSRLPGRGAVLALRAAATFPESGSSVALVDVEALFGRVLGELTSGPGGFAFLADPTGALLLVRGHRQDARTLEELIPGDDAAPARGVLLGTPPVSLRIDAAGEGPLLAASEALHLSGVHLVLGAATARPQPGLRPLVLVGGLALMALAAGAAGVALAFERGRSPAALGAAAAQPKVAVRTGARFALVEGGTEPAVLLRDGLVAEANQAAADHLRLGARVELIGRPFSELVAAEDRIRVEGFLRDAESLGAPVGRLRARLDRADGDRRLVDLAVSAALDDEAPAFRVSWQDVTGQERAEALLRAVAMAIPHSVVLTDPEGNAVWVNRAFREKAGIAPELPAPVLPLVATRDRRRAAAMLARARRGEVVEGFLRVLPASGEPATAAVRAVPVFMAGALFGVAFAATEWSPSAPGGQQSSRRAEALTLLAVSVAHRLSNELQALTGLLEEGAPVADGDIEKVRAVLGRATQEIQRFVVLSRRGAANLKPLRLGGLVQRWLAGGRSKAGSRIRLLATVASAEDGVLADPGQVGLVLDLALGAALAAMARDGGAVEVRVETSTKDWVRLSVSDTGPVAAPSDVPGSLPVAVARRVAGAVAELVAQRHGGRAGERERAGVTHELWLELPCRPGAATPEHAGLTARPGVVMVVEDEEVVRASLAEALRVAGFEVEEADNGVEMLARVLTRPERYALVVLDLVMPVMDGREALKRVRAEAPAVPVLLCTGYDLACEGELESLEILVKPFSLEEFVTTVSAMVERRTGDARI